MVRTAQEKIKKGERNLIDERGKSAARPKMIDTCITESVIEHINLFPRVPSHYTRKDSSREYLEENLSLSVMYNLYIEWAKKQQQKSSDQTPLLRRF